MAIEFNNLSSNDLKELLCNQAYKTYTTALDVVFPPVCLNCLTPTETTNKICPTCWNNIDFIVSPYCEIKGTPFPFHIEQGTISASALKQTPHFDKARSVALYEGTMRELIHKLKYKDRHELTNLFVNWMQQAGKDILKKTDLIIPIPLYRSRIWHRRFNQSALLAKRLSKQTNIPYDCTLLIRGKKTKSQVGLTANERYQNLKNAFTIDNTKKEILRNKTILLIDDVITTGATINTASKLLKSTDVDKVYVLSLALVSTISDI